MEMHQIRYFLAVCDTLNFTRAGELCHVSQPSLTQAIKKLEEELAGPLFERGRTGTRLTELGRLLHPFMEQIMAGSQAAMSSAHQFIKLEKAPLKIGVMLTVGPRRLAPFLSYFQGEYPGIEVELHEGKEEPLLKRLMKESLDVVITAPLGDLDASFRSQPLYREGYVVVFPPGHRFQSMERVRLKDLSGEPYLDRLSCEMRDTVMAVCAEKEVILYAKFRSEREDWIQGMVTANMGVAFMPEYSIVFDGIGVRPLVEPEVHRNVKLISMETRTSTPAMETFLQSARAWNWLS